jgi:hypothetical protein
LTPLGLTYDRYERYARVSEAPHKLLIDAARRFDEYQHWSIDRSNRLRAPL